MIVNSLSFTADPRLVEINGLKDVDNPETEEEDPPLGGFTKPFLKELKSPARKHPAQTGPDSALLEDDLSIDTEDPCFVELEEPVLKEEDDPLEKLEEPDENFDPVDELAEEPVDADDPLNDPALFKIEIEALLAELEDPELNETDEPRLSLEENPEIKHPAQSRPVPALEFMLESSLTEDEEESLMDALKNPEFTSGRRSSVSDMKDSVLKAVDPWLAVLENPELKLDEPDENVDSEFTAGRTSVVSSIKDSVFRFVDP